MKYFEIYMLSDGWYYNIPGLMSDVPIKVGPYKDRTKAEQDSTMHEAMY